MMCSRFDPLLILAASCLAFAGEAGARAAQDADAMAPLQKIQDLVGNWKGAGVSDANKGWDESLHCVWKFKNTGQCGLYLKLESPSKDSGKLFDEMAITFDVKRELYVLKGNKAGDDTENALAVFEGKLAGEGQLIVERVGKGIAKDSFDRIDFKLLNDGDRLVYIVHRRIGQTRRYRKFAQVSLDREGASLAGAGKPKCIVTGGVATMTVGYNGHSYPVCCTGCREMFLENPQKYLARIEKKGP